MQVLDRVTAAHEKLEFGESGRVFYDFFWAQYADWYIESAKTRLYSSDAAVSQTTRKVRPLLPLRRRSMTAAKCHWRMRIDRNTVHAVSESCKVSSAWV